MMRISGLLVFAMLSSCSTFSTAFSTELKFDHQVKKVIESAEQATNESKALKA